MYKRLFTAIIGLTIVAALSACNAPGAPNEEQTPAEKNQQTQKPAASAEKKSKSSSKVTYKSEKPGEEVIYNKERKEAIEEQAPKNSFTIEEVLKHASINDCWIFVHKNVFDITDLIKTHPDAEFLIRNCGGNATEAIANQEAITAQILSDNFYLGKLK